MKRLGYRLILPVVLLFSSCVTIQPVTVERIEKITLTGLPLNPAIHFHAVVQNPNFFGLSLHRLSADFAMEGQVVARVNMAEQRHLSARSSISIPLSVRPDLKNTAGLLLSGSTLSKWHTDGIIEIRKWMFRKTFPFSVSGQF
jgi:LEA14-like dessication related protein